MKITISGTPASGKSTAARLLAEKLGFKHFSMGDFQREIAKEKGITIKELADLEAKDNSIDLMVDEHQQKIGMENKDFVMDSWLAPRFVPDSIKIFIDADPAVRASRRFSQKRDEESFDAPEKALEDMNQRQQLNRERWIRLYDFDILDMANYDIVVDSTHLSIEEVVENIYLFVKTFR